MEGRNIEIKGRSREKKSVTNTVIYIYGVGREYKISRKEREWRRERERARERRREIE